MQPIKQLASRQTTCWPDYGTKTGPGLGRLRPSRGSRPCCRGGKAAINSRPTSQRRWANFRGTEPFCGEICIRFMWTIFVRALSKRRRLAVVTISRSNKRPDSQAVELLGFDGSRAVI